MTTDAQLALPTIIKPDVITTHGNLEFQAALTKVELEGGRVIAMARGRNNGEWVLTIKWPSVSPAKELAHQSTI